MFDWIAACRRLLAAWALVAASLPALAQQPMYEIQKPYTLSPGVDAGKIRVGTADRGYVEYDVQAGGSYNIIWNRRDGIWDVRTRRDG